MIAEAGLSIVQGGDKVQRTDISSGNRPPNEENEISQAGQASDAGPAVVANFSAAALETSRAVSQTTQTADQNSTASERPEQAPVPPPTESTIDTYA